MKRDQDQADLTGPEEPRPKRATIDQARAVVPSLVGMLVAVLAVALLRTTGTFRGSVDALVIMGFDADRAMLITALIAGALAAGLVAVCGGHSAAAVLASVGATAAVFGKTFLHETRTAIASSGAAGVFDPLGWLGSVMTLVVAAVIVGWAAGTLTAIATRFVVVAARDARASLRARPIMAAGLTRAAIVVAILALLVATMPMFGDMVNYTPDAHMRRGGTPVAGLADAGTGTHPSPGPQSSSPGAGSPSGAPDLSTRPSSAPDDPGHLPTDLANGPVPGSLITPGVVATSRPWAASIPTGPGQVTRIDLPAPWTHGSASVAIVDVYLPPGYATSRTRYPVLYEVPYAMPGWDTGVGIKSMLDNLIDSGAIPPMVVVFASEFGGPYRDGECSDSLDGREKFDTYVAKQLVSYVDTHYRTIAAPAARTLLGDSQGGYCSVALWSHHPDVFDSAISFSGYFVSGIVSFQTRNAALPFGSDAAYEAAQSPMDIVPQMSIAVRDRSFVVLSAGSDQSLFASQLRTFAEVLDRARVPMAILPSRFGHSWQTPRDLLPTVLELIAGRMVKLGVFGSL
jgi:enterochelin esterase-like enzyme